MARKTPNQKAWQDENFKLIARLNRLSKQGGSVSPDIIPQRPNIITTKSLQAFKKANEQLDQEFARLKQERQEQKRQEYHKRKTTDTTVPSSGGNRQRPPTISTGNPHGNPQNLKHKGNPNNLQHKGRPKGSKNKTKTTRTSNKTKEDTSVRELNTVEISSFINDYIDTTIEDAMSGNNNSTGANALLFEKLLNQMIYKYGDDFTYDLIRKGIEDGILEKDKVFYGSDQEVVYEFFDDLFDLLDDDDYEDAKELIQEYYDNKEDASDIYDYQSAYEN